jgi:hypothetical protein
MKKEATHPDPLLGLVGLRIAESTQDGSSLLLTFANAGILRIDLCHIFAPPVSQRDGLVGRVIRSVFREDQMIRICLDDSRVLQIDLRPERYAGPEAMLLRLPGYPLLVE